MREMVSVTLESAGFTVVQGEHGQDALDRLGSAAVQLIITDLNMPVMDGMEFIRAVRSKQEHRFTPILMLTTESQEERKKQGKEAGATGWLVKPFDPEKLLAVVAKVLP
jgi:two-component system chemotaxis response regulator CheY